MVESRQPGALAVTVVFPIFAALFVAARTASRILGRNFGWDDWLIYLALLLLLGQTITIYEYIIISHTGFRSKDVPKQTVDQELLATKWSFAVQMIYHPLMGTIRASIIMFLFRVKDRRRSIHIALHVAFWMNLGYTLSTSIVNVFQCSPIKYAYMRPQMDQELDAQGNTIEHGKCINSLAFIMASCGISVLMDLIIIPIPTVMVWNLQMRRKTKVAIVAIMSMGWIATAASVARIIVYYNRSNAPDRTWDIGLIASISEPSIGILAACAPALRRLFTHLMPHYFTEGDTTVNNYTYASESHTQDNANTLKRDTLTVDFRFSRGNMSKGMGDPGMGDRKEVEVYGMAPLKSPDSGELLGGMDAFLDVSSDAGTDLEMQGGNRLSVRTGMSDPPGEVVEAVPEHLLSKR
ncbi:hypothetical protein P280DRAFT_150290 [Massarina eburnea CBS 473.64]|uniref:Rhodopsin domain-containing protein n=1 Tax=Massarina eburnea CBS 473.64 TaxID=1395130 RepID=A0A6A6RQB1_9PLEO|nr:hypothetical protein P280DRAFT_150290 [Massarina eburnea CBS 473.64]